MSDNNWVDKILLRWKAKNTNNVEEDLSKIYDISPTFENVRYSSNYTLLNFFNTVKAFFDKQMHMIYQQTEPKDLKIMEWYHVIPDNNSANDSDEKRAAKNDDSTHIKNS